MTNNFNDYMVDLLLEQVASKEMKLYFSPRFKKYITSIEHPISKRLLDSENSDDIMVKKTYIDLDDNETDKVTFISVSKAMSYVIDSIGEDSLHLVNFFNLSKDVNSPMYKKHRVSMKINKVINQLFPDEFKPSGEPGNDMESFVNIFKSKRSIGTFELVKGDDIIKFYNEDNYADTEGGGSLASSCMRGEDCSGYIEFYAKNSDVVSLLILKDDDDDTKIKGRALVWNLSQPDRIFMDRIYTFFDSDVDRFKDHAKQNEWLYKSKQNMDNSAKIVDTKTGEMDDVNMFIDDLNNTDEYPYMDTTKFYDIDSGKLTNVDEYFDEYYFLEDLSGGHEYINNGEDDDRIYSHHYGEYYDIEELEYCENVEEYRLKKDCYWSEFYNSWYDIEDAEHNMIPCDYVLDVKDKYRTTNDSTRLVYYDAYAANDYLESSESEFVYNEYEGVYVKKGDGVWSKYHSTNLNKEVALQAYTNVDRTETDWRSSNDSSYFKHTDYNFYADTVNKEDIK